MDDLKDIFTAIDKYMAIQGEGNKYLAKKVKEIFKKLDKEVETFSVEDLSKTVKKINEKLKKINDEKQIDSLKTNIVTANRRLNRFVELMTKINKSFSSIKLTDKNLSFNVSPVKSKDQSVLESINNKINDIQKSLTQSVSLNLSNNVLLRNIRDVLVLSNKESVLNSSTPDKERNQLSVIHRIFGKITELLKDRKYGRLPRGDINIDAKGSGIIGFIGKILTYGLLGGGAILLLAPYLKKITESDIYKNIKDKIKQYVIDPIHKKFEKWLDNGDLSKLKEFIFERLTDLKDFSWNITKDLFGGFKYFIKGFIKAIKNKLIGKTPDNPTVLEEVKHEFFNSVTKVFVGALAAVFTVGSLKIMLSPITGIITKALKMTGVVKSFPKLLPLLGRVSIFASAFFAVYNLASKIIKYKKAADELNKNLDESQLMTDKLIDVRRKNETRLKSQINELENKGVLSEKEKLELELKKLLIEKDKKEIENVKEINNLEQKRKGFWHKYMDSWFDYIDDDIEKVRQKNRKHLDDIDNSVQRLKKQLEETSKLNDQEIESKKKIIESSNILAGINPSKNVKVNDAVIVEPHHKDQILMAKENGVFDKAMKELIEETRELKKFFIEGLHGLAIVTSEGSDNIVKAVVSTGGSNSNSSHITGLGGIDPIRDQRDRNKRFLDR